MSSSGRYDRLSQDQFDEIHAVCELFEKRLLEGKQVSIESQLLAATVPTRDILFDELLAIELEWRLARGDSPDINDFQRRFPKRHAHVQRLFEEATAAETLRWNKSDRDREQQTPGAGSQNVPGFLCDGNYESLEQPGTKIGPYKLVECIGYGGMGTVWRARQQYPVVRDVAVKLIKVGMDTRQVVARFETERQTLAIMDHPHIARVLDAGSTDAGRPYFIMELVDGEPITDYCDGRKLTLDTRLKMFVTVCDAVQHAHQKGIIHRDIKPSNVLVGESENKPVPKVIDFGLAKATEQKVPGQTVFTAVGQLIGTPNFMSPEQARLSNHDIDTRTDVYSLGVLLYELLSGSPPFDFQTDASADYESVLRAIREDTPPQMNVGLPRLDDASRNIAADRGTNLKTLHSRLHGDLDVIVHKALEKNRDRRYQTPRDLAEDIGRYLRDEAIEARPASLLYRWRKTAARNKRAVMLMTLLAMSLLLGIAGVAFQAIRATNAERKLAAQLLIAERLTVKAEERTKVERWERYRTAMAAVSNAMLGSEDSGLARRSLDTAPAEHRGWEWYYYDSRLKDTSLTMLDFGISDHAYCPVFAMHPTQWQLGLHQPNGQATTWDPNQKPQPTLASNYPHGASAIAFHSDGSLLAIAADDFSVHVWNTQTGRRLCHLVGHQKTVTRLAFHPDGSQIASGGFDHEVRIWDLATNMVAATQKLSAECTGLAFSQNDRRLIITSGQEVFSRSMGEIETQYRGATSAVEIATVSHDGRLLAVGTSAPANEVLIWDVQSAVLLTTLQGHSNQISGLAFDTSGSRIASISLDQTARLWDVGTGAPLHVFRGHSAALYGLALNSDATRLVTGARDGTARCWDTHTGEQVILFRGHQAEVSQVAFSHDDSQVVTASFDGTIRIWDSRADTANLLRGHKSYVYDVAFHPTENQIVSVGWDGKLLQWNLNTGLVDKQYSHPTDVITSVAVDVTGQRMVTLSRQSNADRNGRNVMIWDCATGKLQHTIPVPGPNWIESRADVSRTNVARPPSGRASDPGLIAVGDDAGKLWIFDLEQGEPYWVLQAHIKEIVDVAFRPSSRVREVASCSKDLTIQIWNLAQRKRVATLRGHKSEIHRILYNRDGQLLASASSDKTVRLWHADTHELLAELPHGSMIYGLAFSPDGTRLATACADKTVRLWDLRKFQEVAKLRGHTDYVHAVAFSPDGTRIASASGDSTIRIWDALSARARANQIASYTEPRR